MSKRKEPCDRCKDWGEVQDLDNAVDDSEPYACDDCGTRFVLTNDKVHHVFSKKKVSVPRDLRPFLAWQLGEVVKKRHRVVYFSCPRCARILKEEAFRIDVDGMVYRAGDVCFTCDGCGMHFWVMFEGWVPLRRRKS